MANDQYIWIDDSIEDFERFAMANLGDINEELDWTGRKVGTSGLHSIKRTPLMLAATYSSFQVLNFILTITGLNINSASSTDGLTALDCAYLYEAHPEIGRMLKSRDAQYRLSDDPGLIKLHISIMLLLNNNMQYWLHETEDFMMFDYKVKTCNGNEGHYGQFCPYLHSTEDIRRRRDVRGDNGTLKYEGFPCLGGPDRCPKGPDCKFAHGHYEIWYHPNMFRTQRCTYKMLCRRMACPFAHHSEFEYRGKSSASIGPAVPLPPYRNVLGTVTGPARVTDGDRAFGFDMHRVPSLFTHPEIPFYGSLVSLFQAWIQLCQNRNDMNPMAQTLQQNLPPCNLINALQSHPDNYRHGLRANFVFSTAVTTKRLQSSGFHGSTLGQSSRREELGEADQDQDGPVITTAALREVFEKWVAEHANNDPSDDS